MALTLDELFASPDHYLHSFDGDAALFVPMDREAYRRSIFLDGRIQPKANQQMRLQSAALLGALQAPRPTGWIFHVAHCGSTLLARALDHDNLVLREPLALRQMALAPDPNGLRLVAAMLSKRYAADLPTLVKANVPVNFLLPELAVIEPEARAIFLYLELGDYCLAILRNDRHREWLANVTRQLARYLGDLSALSDAQRLAALWSAQMRLFAGAIGAMPGGRSLDAESFFAEPARQVRAAAAHLEVVITDETVEAMTAGPLFSTYSKNPELKFDNAARLARRRALEGAMAPEIEEAEAWVKANAPDAAEAMERVRGAALV